MPLDGGNVKESKAMANKAKKDRDICLSSGKNLVGSRVVCKTEILLIILFLHCIFCVQMV